MDQENSRNMVVNLIARSLFKEGGGICSMLQFYTNRIVCHQVAAFDSIRQFQTKDRAVLF